MSSVAACQALRFPLCRWAAVPDDEWPEPGMQRDVVIQDFDLSSAFGDRRQEIVFIGRNMQQDAITQRLDGALLTDAEMDQYKQRFCKVRLERAWPLVLQYCVTMAVASRHHPPEHLARGYGQCSGARLWR